MDFFTLLFGNLVSVAMAFGVYRLYHMYYEYVKLQQLYKCAQFLTVYAGTIGAIISVDRIQRFFNMSQHNTDFLREVANNVNQEMFELKRAVRDIKEVKKDESHDVLMKSLKEKIKQEPEEFRLPANPHLDRLDEIPVH
jgi:hypothetical protein